MMILMTKIRSLLRSTVMVVMQPTANRKKFANGFDTVFTKELSIEIKFGPGTVALKKSRRF
jgi:hypothetical protein